MINGFYGLKYLKVINNKIYLPRKKEEIIFNELFLIIKHEGHYIFEPIDKANSILETTHTRNGSIELSEQKNMCDNLLIQYKDIIDIVKSDENGVVELPSKIIDELEYDHVLMECMNDSFGMFLSAEDYAQYRNFEIKERKEKEQVVKNTIPEYKCHTKINTYYLPYDEEIGPHINTEYAILDHKDYFTLVSMKDIYSLINDMDYKKLTSDSDNNKQFANVLKYLYNNVLGTCKTDKFGKVELPDFVMNRCNGRTVSIVENNNKIYIFPNEVNYNLFEDNDPNKTR